MSKEEIKKALIDAFMAGINFERKFPYLGYSSYTKLYAEEAAKELMK